MELSAATAADSATAATTVSEDNTASDGTATTAAASDGTLSAGVTLARQVQTSQPLSRFLHREQICLRMITRARLYSILQSSTRCIPTSRLMLRVSQITQMIHWSSYIR